MTIGSKFSITKRNFIKKRDQRKSDNIIITVVAYLELEEISVQVVMLQVVVAMEWLLFVLPTYYNSPYHIVMDIMTMPVLQFEVNQVLSRVRAKCSKCIYIWNCILSHMDEIMVCLW